MKSGNLLKFGSRILLSGIRQLDHPYKLNIMVTNRCNQKCAICRIWEEKPEDLPLRDIRMFFSKSNSFSWIDVSGGEIFLRPDILEVFSTITENCRRLSLLHFATNGLMAEEILRCTRTIRSMGTYKLVITVSVDGPPEIHDSLRSTVGAFDRALETYNRLRELPGCQVYLGMTLQARNTERYDETLAAIIERAPHTGPENIHINIAHSASHYGNKDYELFEKSSMAKNIRKILTARRGGWRLLDIIERRYLRLALRYLNTGFSPLPCRALSASCFVDTAGQVYPCVSWQQPLGSLRETEGDLIPIWTGYRAQKIRDHINHGKCPGCWTPCEAVPAILGNILKPTAARLETVREAN